MPGVALGQRPNWSGLGKCCRKAVTALTLPTVWALTNARHQPIQRPFLFVETDPNGEALYSSRSLTVEYSWRRASEKPAPPDSPANSVRANSALDPSRTLESPDGHSARKDTSRHDAPKCNSDRAKHSAAGSEPVKRFETHSYDAFCASSSTGTGSLIQATVGSFGGCGRGGRTGAGWRRRPHRESRPAGTEPRRAVP